MPALVFASEAQGKMRLDESLSELGLQLLVISSIIVTLIVIFAVRNPLPTERFKLWAFIGIIFPVVVTTSYLTTSTIYLNYLSSSKGPVHWHADFKIFHCGSEVDLISPTGLSNRVGTPVLHEHGDNRIHVEGVVLESEHVKLAEFFRVVGGYLGKEEVRIPTDNGLQIIKNGNTCSSGKPGMWQVFVYQTNPDIGQIQQHKIENYSEYILSPYSVVPPADCIIFEFDSVKKSKTDKVCNFHQIEINKGTYKLVN